MKKSRFFSYLITFMLCACTFGIGVWSASASANVALGGNISFVPPVQGYAKVSATITGQASGASTLAGLVYEEGKTVDQSGWSDVALTFDANKTPIKVTITIDRLDTSKEVYVKVKDNTATTTNLTSRFFDFNNMAQLTGADTQKTITIYYSATDLTEAVSSFNLSLSVNLQTEKIKVIDSSDIYTGTNAFTGKDDHYVNMGKYPQRHVKDENVPEILKNDTTGMYSNGIITLSETVGSTSFIKYRDIEAYGTYTIKRDPNTGREYVEAVVSPYKATYTYSDETPVGDVVADMANADTAWFELEPIQWLILGYYNLNEDGTIKVKESTTDASTGVITVTYDYVGRFDGTGTSTKNDNFNPYQNNIQLQLVSNKLLSGMALSPHGNTPQQDYWTASVVRTWLNGNFANQAFGTKPGQNVTPTGVWSQIVTGNDSVAIDGEKDIFGINTNANNDNQTWQDTSSDSVWLLSTDEANNKANFDIDDTWSSASLQAMATDFSVAHYAQVSLDGSFVVGDYWWLRSAVDESDSQCGMVIRGHVGASYRFYAYAAVRPAILLSI